MDQAQHFFDVKSKLWFQSHSSRHKALLLILPFWNHIIWWSKLLDIGSQDCCTNPVAKENEYENKEKSIGE